MHRNAQYSEYAHCMSRRSQRYASRDLEHTMIVWWSRRYMLEVASLLIPLTSSAKIWAKGPSAANLKGKLRTSSTLVTTVPRLPSKETSSTYTPTP